MAAQRIAGHHLGLAIGRCGVEVIDTVGDGIIDHRVDGFLVQGLVAAEAASAAALRGQAHAAQTEHAQGLPHFAPGAGVDFGARRGFLPGRHRREIGCVGAHAEPLQDRSAGGEADASIEQALEGFTPGNLLVHDSYVNLLIEIRFLSGSPRRSGAGTPPAGAAPRSSPAQWRCRRPG